MSTSAGPYTPAVGAGPWLVCSGQLGIVSAGPPPVLADSFEAQARQALVNLRQLLEHHGLGWPDVVKVTAFLADIADYATFNQLYLAEVGEHRPARSVVAVAALPLQALVEVEAWAWRP